MTRHRGHKAFDIMQDPLVSIIVTTYNRRTLLPIAIRSVVNQQHRNLECIVVNDGGEDVAGLINGFNDKRIQYVNLPKNGGLAQARNAGLKVARGEYIGFLDDDDRLLTRHVRLLVACLRENEADMAYANADKLYLDWQDGKYVDVAKEEAAKGEAYGSQDFDHRRILYENWIPVECHLSHCSLFDSIRFDPGCNPYEDWDFLIQASRRVHPVHLVETTSVFTERTEGTGMLGSAVETNKRLDAINYIFEKWPTRDQQVLQGRAQILNNEKERIVLRRRLQQELDDALAAPDITEHVKNRIYWKTQVNALHANAAMKRAQLAGDTATAEKINLLLGALR